MKTIVLAAAKGGTGKTSLTAALAIAAAQDHPDIRVAVVDLDPQGSLTWWWNKRAQEWPHLCVLSGVPLVAALPGLRSARFDLLIADCPPGFSNILNEAIAAADLILVPAQASALDLEAVASTAKMAEVAGVPHRFVLNRAVFRSRLAGQAVLALRDRGGLLLPPVHQRVEIAAAMASGHVALETKPDGAAAHELAALWVAVRAALHATPVRRHVDRARLPALAIARRAGT